MTVGSGIIGEISSFDGFEENDFRLLQADQVPHHHSTEEQKNVVRRQSAHHARQKTQIAATAPGAQPPSRESF
jgi:hypothetical protein